MIQSRHAIRLAYVSLALFSITTVLPSALPLPGVSGVALLRDSSGRDISGHGSSGIVGNQLERAIAVVVTGEDGQPVAGAAVHFVLVPQPDKAKGASVAPSVARTDADGIAKAGEILRRDNQVDAVQGAITLYLTRVAQQNLSLAQSDRVLRLLHVPTEVEHVGDVIEKDLVSLVMEKAEDQIDFSPEGREELVEYHDRIVASYDDTVKAFQQEDVALAQSVATTKPELVTLERVYRQTHCRRLTEERQQSLESSQIHLDLLDGLRRVNSYSVSIARVVM